MVFNAYLMAGLSLSGTMPAALPRLAADFFAEAGEAAGEGVTVTLLYQGELADSSQIFIVRDARERPLGIVQLSCEAAPDMVARGVSRARIAAAALGPKLGRAVLLPLLEGRIEGRSYAVMPYCLPFSHRRWRWALERRALQPSVLDWLRGAAAATLVGVPGPDIEGRFRRPLLQLRKLDGASSRLVECTERALSRLASGAWVPRHVLMHADLWKGNLLLRPPSRTGPARWRPRWSDRLTIIDWAGAQPRGYAFFDLVRAVSSLRIGAGRLRTEVARHCAILGCEPVDAPGYVLTAAGAILGEIGHFPQDRLLTLAESSLATIDDAVAPTGSPAAQR